MEQAVIATIISLYGVLIGSFLNVLIYRIPRGENFVVARSYCPQCNHQLTARDLIPLFSYLITAGKCRYCQKSIPMRYPLVELLNGLLYLLIYLRSGINAYAILDMLLCSTVVVIAFIDYDTNKILNATNLTIMVLALIKLVVTKVASQQHVAAVLFAMIVCVFFVVMSLLLKKTLFGMGDIKYILAISFYFTLNQFIVFIASSFVTAGAFAIGAILMGKLRLQDSIAFAPFLAISSIFVILQ